MRSPMLALMLVLAWSWPGPAPAETVVPLALGDGEIRIALPEGYLPASEKAPALFATSSAAMPPPVRLVEALLTEADLKRLLGVAHGPVSYTHLTLPTN